MEIWKERREYLQFLEGRLWSKMAINHTARKSAAWFCDTFTEHWKTLNSRTIKNIMVKSFWCGPENSLPSPF